MPPEKNNNAKVEDWMKKPPYQIHKPEDKFEAKLHASCHCGKVKYQLSSDKPLGSKLCHCTTCQSQHAAPFQWAAIFHKTDINFLHGYHDLEWYSTHDKSVEHKLPAKVRCSFCHSPIMDEGRNMILLFPSLIDLSSPKVRENFKPRWHMFYSERVVDVPDGLPKWSGMEKTSDLIEDSPAEAIKELERQRMKKRKADEDEGTNGDSKRNSY